MPPSTAEVGVAADGALAPSFSPFFPLLFPSFSSPLPPAFPLTFPFFTLFSPPFSLLFSSFSPSFPPPFPLLFPSLFPPLPLLYRRKPYLFPGFSLGCSIALATSLRMCTEEGRGGRAGILFLAFPAASDFCFSLKRLIKLFCTNVFFKFL